MSFQEVSGLDTEAKVSEYKSGNNLVFSVANKPNRMKTGNVSLKKGVIEAGNEFWDWYERIKMNSIERRTVTIILHDENGSPLMTWTLSNAWPARIIGTELKSDGNEVAVEAIEMAHEGITIQNK